MSDHTKESPRDVIERIRSSFLVDLSDLPEKARAGAANLQRQLNRALGLLEADLYAKKTHFLLELVQNADDNEYHFGTTPELSFVLSESQLTLINNEMGFTEANVDAICNVGASSKAASKDRHIGEKGIGFKAVFSVSNAPEIHSNGFHFRFDRSDAENLLGYVVPRWISPPKDLRPGVTTIVLPAAAGAPFGPSTLADLDARVLLFLNKLRKLTLTIDGNRHVFNREDAGDICHLVEESTVGKSVVKRQAYRYLRTMSAIDIDKAAQDEKRPGMKSSTIVLAFPLDEAGAANPEPSSKLFAFLPVKEFGFKFAIHADFLLSSSRESLLEGRPWNVRLRDGIASAFLESLLAFRASPALGCTYLQFLPAINEIADPFFAEVRGKILRGLKDVESLPSASGVWKRPSELRLADTAFRELFPTELAIELFGFDYIDQQVEGGASLLRELGVKDVAPNVALAVFQRHGSWLGGQPLTWRAKFYAYLADRPSVFTKAALCDLPCIPTLGGTYAVPSKSTIFFPLGKAKKYGFENELTFVDSELYDAAEELSKSIPALFVLLGIKTDEPYDLVVGHILPLHKEDRWKDSGYTALVGHLRYVKDKLPRYLDGALQNGKSEVQAFQLLSEGIRIGTRHKDSASWTFNRINNLYLGKEFHPEFCIETLVPDVLDGKLFVSPDYMASRPRDSQAEAESWRTFFRRLGVRMSPALSPAGSNWVASKEMQALLASAVASTRSATLECIDRNWPYYASKLVYIIPFGRGKVTSMSTGFAAALRSTVAPLATRRKAVPLSQAYYRTPELAALLGDGLPYVDAVLSPPLLDACGITYRPTVATLIRRLTQLKEDGSGTTKQVQSIYRSLDTQFWATDAAAIRRAFESEALIQLKGIHKGWFKLDEVAWRSNGLFIDSIFPPLQATYKDFQGFFNERLGIPRELPIQRWVSALALLDRISDVKERQFEALTIYRRANRELARFRREGSVPEWIETFKHEDVYINQRGDMVPNDEYLFANDRPDLAALFADEEDLSFIAVPSSDVPNLARLFDAAQVNRLSDSVDVEVPDVEDGILDAALTRKVRDGVPLFSRILYSRHTDAFDDALESGAISMLWDVMVFEVSEPIAQIVSIGTYQREQETQAAFTQSGQIVYVSNMRVREDRIASLISERLLGSNELAEMFARVLMSDGSGSIEDLFAIWGVSELPPDHEAAIRQRSAFNGAPGDAEQSNADRAPAAPDDDAGDDVSSVDQRPGAAPPPAPETRDADSTPPENVAAATPTHISNPTQPLDPGHLGSSPVPTAPAENASKPLPSDSAGLLGGSNQQYAARPTGRVYRGPSGSRPSSPPNLTTSPPRPAPTPFFTQTPPQPLASGEGHQGSVPAQGAHPIQMQPGGGQAARPTHRAAADYRPNRGRLLSYVESSSDQREGSATSDGERAEARDAVGRAAVAFFLSTQAMRWESLEEMHHNNPGFDVLATTESGEDEFIEVKGQSSAWTQEGVALTPTELLMAQRMGPRYWLCVVEFALDERRRQLHLVQNPFGLVTQFRFDVGWKDVAISMLSLPVVPEKEQFIVIEGIGQGRIISVRGKGKFFNVHVILRDGKQINRPFNPAKMKLFKEPPWQE